MRIRLPYGRHVVFALSALTLLSACERPFVDVTPPTIEVIEPDFSTIFIEEQALLRVRASSFRAVTRIDIGGLPMAFDPETQTWEAPLQFSRGLNTIVLSAFDEEGIEGRDTLHAVHMTFRAVTNAPTLDTPLGGHTATLLFNGDILVMGGANAVGEIALEEVHFLPKGSAQFAPLQAHLQVARTGHTATLLPDGRVLILGGSSHDDFNKIEDLIETAEVFDPVTQISNRVIVDGPPIRRALHTALLRTTTAGSVIDLLGGRGDIQYTPSPQLGTRRDVRSFFLSNDSLIALSPAPGPFIEAISGHTQIALNQLALGEAGRYLVSTSFFIDNTSDDTSFIMDLQNDFGILTFPTAAPLLPRTRHAAALLRGGLISYFGGRQASPSEVLEMPELYVETTEQFYQFPVGDSLSLPKRFGHTATKLSDTRILLIGGFTLDGTGTVGSAYFEFDL